MIALLSSRNYSKVDAKTFIPEKFSPSDAALAVSALKFLRLIDDNNAATELMSKLHLKGEAQKKEFEKIVRSAYSKLFDVVEKPQDLSQDDLHNEMLRQYNKITAGTVRSAVLAFLKLCEYAGLKEEGSIVSKARATRSKTLGAFAPRLKNQRKEASGSMSVSGPLYSFPIVPGRLYLNIETEMHNRSFIDDKLGADLRTLIKAAHKFANDHITKDETPEQGSEVS